MIQQFSLVKTAHSYHVALPPCSVCTCRLDANKINLSLLLGYLILSTTENNYNYPPKHWMIAQIPLKVARNVHWNYQREMVNNKGHFLDISSYHSNAHFVHPHRPLVTNYVIDWCTCTKLACRTGAIFLRILGKQRRKRGECELRGDELVPSLVTHALRSPLFRHCSPKICQNIAPVLQASIGHTRYEESITSRGLGTSWVYFAYSFLSFSFHLLYEISPF